MTERLRRLRTPGHFPAELSKPARRAASSLEGCWAKVERAYLLIDALREEILGGAVTSRGETVRVSRLTRAGELAFVLVGAPPPVPPVLGILAGEAIAELHSVLDHLLYCLIVTHTNRRPPFKVSFPIVGRRRRTAMAWSTAGEEYEIRTSRLRQYLSASTEKMLYEVQPFHLGRRYAEHPLWVLSALRTLNEQRLLRLRPDEIVLYRAKVMCDGEEIDVTVRPSRRWRRVRNAGAPSIQSWPDEQPLKAFRELVFSVTFDEVSSVKGVSAVTLLTLLANYVSEIVERFAT